MQQPARWRAWIPAAALLVAGLAAPLQTAPVRAQPPPDLTVRVAGPALVEAGGHPVRLVGVNRAGSEFKCVQAGSPGARGTGVFDGPTDPVSVAAMAAWRVNVVRLPLNEDCWLGINGVNPQWGGRAYQAAIAQYVATLHEGGMRVILDLHWSAPGAFAALGQQPMPDSDHAPDFWRSVAGAFRNDPAVIFDVFNEPYLDQSFQQDRAVNPWHCWMSGCTLIKYITEGQESRPYVWQASGMQALVNAVRSTGARQPIMVAGIGWASDTTGWLPYRLTDPAHQLVAAWHAYPGSGCANQNCWEQYVRPVAEQVPVLIGELGDSVCGDAGYVGGLLNWADSVGVGYLGWTWNTWSNCENVLVRSYDGTPTPQYGTAFRDHLRSLPAAVPPLRPAPSRVVLATAVAANAVRQLSAHPWLVASGLAGLLVAYLLGFATARISRRRG